MEKNLYIDASHPNETRIVLKSNNSIEEYEFEDKNNLNFKNNIYLGTVSRVEPSLQAAFVNFGRDRHGFLAFNDIQSDYYQIPSEDKEKIKIAEEEIREKLKEKTTESSSENIQVDLENAQNNDDIEDEKDRMKAIKYEIKRLINLEKKQIHDIYYSTMDILKHNRNHWLSNGRKRVIKQMEVFYENIRN